jgi:hypothetical protein
MDQRTFTRTGAAVLALSFAMVSPVLAQAITKDNGAGTGKMTETEKAGRSAGQNSADASTEPRQPTTAQTGVEPRGTKVAPSTNPGETGEKAR